MRVAPSVTGRRAVETARRTRRPSERTGRPGMWSAVVGALAMFGAMATRADERLYGK